MEDSLAYNEAEHEGFENPASPGEELDPNLQASPLFQEILDFLRAEETRNPRLGRIGGVFHKINVNQPLNLRTVRRYRAAHREKVLISQKIEELLLKAQDITEGTQKGLADIALSADEKLTEVRVS